MREIMDVLKALADENRLRALGALQGGKLCVCQLVALLKLAPSTVSKHLSILRAARLVESRKVGRWMYYSLPGEFRAPLTGKWLALLLKDAAKTRRIGEDRKRLKQICGEDLDALCRAGRFIPRFAGMSSRPARARPGRLAPTDVVFREKEWNNG